MKATLSTSELREAVQTVRKVVPAKATLPALRHILLEMAEGRLQITGTDLQNAIIVEVPAVVEGSGQVVAPGKELGELLAAMPEEEIVLEDDAQKYGVKVSAADGMVVLLPGLNPTDYPAIQASGQVVASFEATAFARAARWAAIPAKSAEKQRSRWQRWVDPVATWIKAGPRAETIEVLAADKHRLHAVEIPATIRQEGFVLPLVDVEQVAPLLEGTVTMAVQELGEALQQAVFRAGRKTILSTVANAPLVDMPSIPAREPDLTITVPARGLVDALKLALLGGGDIISFQAEDGSTLAIAAQGRGAGGTRVQVPWADVRGRLCFQILPYLVLDALKGAAKEQMARMSVWASEQEVQAIELRCGPNRALFGPA